LGSGYTYDTTLVSTQQITGTVLARLTEAYRIYQKLPNAKLITSGPNTNSFISQGKVAANAAVEFGVSPGDTAFLSKSVNTETEAKFYRERFPNQKQVIIATDALHMPRAMYWFRHYGNHPIPAPTNYKIKVDAYDHEPAITLSLKNINRLKKAIKEYVGLWYAKWKTGNLF